MIVPTFTVAVNPVPTRFTFSAPPEEPIIVPFPSRKAIGIIVTPPDAPYI